METFLTTAGVVVTILGIAAIAVILTVLIYVRVLGFTLTLRYEKKCKDDDETL